jgi:very-long-chain enoyl-CoA reductase
LASFRKNDKKNKGIPKNWGFKYVACANYLWETLGWLTFSILHNVIHRLHLQQSQ